MKKLLLGLLLSGITQAQPEFHNITNDINTAPCVIWGVEVPVVFTRGVVSFGNGYRVARISASYTQLACVTRDDGVQGILFVGPGVTKFYSGSALHYLMQPRQTHNA